MRSEGRVSGRVVDSVTGNVIVGSFVFMDGLDGVTSKSKTDVEGRYVIEGVPAGNYKLRIFKAGYALTEVTDVVVKASEAVSLDISLQKREELEKTPPKRSEGSGTEAEGGFFELEAFTVTADEVKSKQAGLLVLRQRSITIGNSISTEFISRSGAGDVAEALTKVVGANVVDGKFVVIRGLGDRYANTLLDGSVLPSNDPSKKTFQLDIIPAEVVETISTVKTFTPDRPGDFTGGSVDVITKDFPYEFEAKLSFGLGYNSEATGKDILGIAGRDMDTLGGTDESLPDGAGSTPGEYMGSDTLDGTFHTIPFFGVRKQANADTSLALSVGDSYKVFDDGRVGFIVAGNLDHAYGYDDAKTVGRYFSAGSALSAQNKYVVEESKEEIRSGLLSKVVFQPVPQHQFSYRLLYNEISADEVILGDYGFDTETEFSSPEGSLIRSSQTPTGKGDGIGYLQFGQLRHVERLLRSHHFRGEHLFDDLNYLKVDWAASFTDTSERIPLQHDYTTVRIDYPDAESDQIFLTQGNARFPSQTFVTLKDKAKSYEVNLTIPFELKGVESFEVKTGGLVRATDRTSRMRSFSSKFSLQLPGGTGDQRTYFFNHYADPVWLSAPVVVPGFPISANQDIDYNELTTAGGNAQSYNGSEQIDAGYLMADVQLSSQWRLIFGARFEDSSMEVSLEEGWVNAQIFNSNPPSEKMWKDWLPSLSAVYSFGPDDKMNFRASYAKTVARPTFREFAPFRILDTQNKETIQGNDDLERTQIENFDLRYEWFLGDGDIIAFGAFYKDFKDPIVTVVNPTPRYLYSWENVPTGEILGFELEARKQVHDYISLGGNVTYSSSEIDAAGNGSGFGTVFEGQPEIIVNVDIGFAQPDWGIRANVFYNYVDEILRFISTGSIPNLIEESRESLDFNFSKSWGDFTLKFSAKNLLNPRTKIFYEGHPDVVYSDYRKGRDFGLSGSYAF